MNEELIKEIEVQHKLLIENLKYMDCGKAFDMIKEGIDYLRTEKPDDALLELMFDIHEMWTQFEDEKYEKEMKE